MATHARDVTRAAGRRRIGDVMAAKRGSEGREHVDTRLRLDFVRAVAMGHIALVQARAWVWVASFRAAPSDDDEPADVPRSEIDHAWNLWDRFDAAGAMRSDLIDVTTGAMNATIAHPGANARQWFANGDRAWFASAATEPPKGGARWPHPAAADRLTSEQWDTAVRAWSPNAGRRIGSRTGASLAPKAGHWSLLAALVADLEGSSVVEPATLRKAWERWKTACRIQ